MDTLDKMMVRLPDPFCLAAASVAPLFGVEGWHHQGCTGHAVPGSRPDSSGMPLGYSRRQQPPSANRHRGPRAEIECTEQRLTRSDHRCIPGASSTIANRAKGSLRSSATVVRAKGRDLNDPRTRRPLKHRIPAGAFLRGPLTAGPYRLELRRRAQTSA